MRAREGVSLLLHGSSSICEKKEARVQRADAAGSRVKFEDDKTRVRTEVVRTGTCHGTRLHAISCHERQFPWICLESNRN